MTTKQKYEEAIKQSMLEAMNSPVDPKFLARVRKRFEDLCLTTGREYKTEDPKEFPLDEWTLRDYVAEAHYEMRMRAEDIHDQADKNEYNRYKRFVDTYSKYLTNDIKSYEKHTSKYDLTESFKGDEDSINQFKSKAPRFYNVCTAIEKLNNDTDFKVNFSTDTSENGRYEVTFTSVLPNNSSFKGYMNSKGICKIKPTNFILDDTTINYLNQLHNILANFEKHSF